ncbi:hypothetical protein ACJJTC_014209 [Scirpophaga incertulas]
MGIAILAGVGVLLVLIFLLYQGQWRSRKNASNSTTHLVHRLCPHNNVVQSFRVEHKDSLDEHLDVLTKKLAEKEGRLRISKSKIRETQNEIDNLHAIDDDVRRKHRRVLESLRVDLMESERECRRLQEQIEWVSRRRAEIRDEVHQGQKMYVEAAAELANNLTEMYRGRPADRVTDKPHNRCSENSLSYLRRRREPKLPNASTHGSIVIKSPTASESNRMYADAASYE